MSRKTVPSFVGSELSLLKLSFWFEWRCIDFFMKANNAKTAVLGVKCVFWLVDWNWSGPRTNPYVNESLVLCVCLLMMWSNRGWSLEEGANLYFAA